MVRSFALYENYPNYRSNYLAFLNCNIQSLPVYRLSYVVYGCFKVRKNTDGFALRFKEVPIDAFQMAAYLCLAKSYKEAFARKAPFLYEYNRCRRSVCPGDVRYIIPPCSYCSKIGYVFIGDVADCRQHDD